MAFFIPTLVSFLITVLAVFPTIKLAKKYKLLDNPNERKHPAHVQQRIVPRAGGLACFMGIFISILLFIPLEKHILGILLSLIILVIVGLADDRYKDLSPYARLVCLFLVAVIAVGSGIGINFITNPFGGILRLDTFVIPFDFFGLHQIILFADIFAVIWIVWVMNMINWSKGVDGQMPGIVFIASAILGFLSVKFFLGGDPNQLNNATLSFIVSGSALGFLIFNWYPAKIFPGFSGSTIFGFMIAILSILSGAKLATAGLVLLVPATDFLYTFIRRILQKKSPVWGDRGHLHHKLLDLGMSHRQISLFYMIGGALLGFLALSLNSKEKLFTALLISIIIVGGILWLNFFGVYSKPQGPDNG